MKRIMVVFTGGTIGSTKQSEAIDVNGAGSYMIIEQYKALYNGQAGSNVEFDTIQPMNILSENLLAEQWLELAASIRSIPQQQYDGIIVTHGSDTFAYSAAMLGYLLSHTAIPIVLIASNYPLDDERSNGMRNFRQAVRWIEQEAPPGVFAIYENDRAESKLYLATRIMQCESFTDQFRSPYELTLGTLEDGRLIHELDARNPSLTQLAQYAASKEAAATLRYIERFAAINELASDVIYIKPYPGLNYDLYQWSAAQKPKAIVHELYHSATACSVPAGSYSLPAFIKRCRQQGIDVYLVPAKSETETRYASTQNLLEAGAMLLAGIGPEAALVKLMLAYSVLTRSEEIASFMKNVELYYELHREQA